MPVSVDVWRLRVGLFKMPPSKSSRKAGQLHEWQSDVSGPSVGVMICLLFIGMVAVDFVQHPYAPDMGGNVNEPNETSIIPFMQLNLLLAGDVEENPGPSPLLSEADLTILRTGEELNEKPSTLLNKHVHQLYQLKKQDKSITWRDVVLWLAQLMEKPVTDLPSEAAVQLQWNRLKTERLSFLKNKSTHPERLTMWQETPYTVAVTKGPTGPGASSSSSSTSELATLKDVSESLAKEVHELTEENERLRQRPSPRKMKVITKKEKRQTSLIKEQRDTLNKVSTKLDKEKRKVSSLKKTKRSLSLEKERLKNKFVKLDESIEGSIADTETTIDTLEEELNLAKEEILQLKESNAHLKSLLEDKESGVAKLLKLNDKGHLSYSPQARLCVYKLLSLHISFENVGKAIETVLNLVGKTADQLPSDRTVSHMNDERLLISQHQMQELTEKQNLTLGTDETPKEGDIYMTYTVSDEESSFVLGLREIVSKSADDTLDTFKVILDDITNVCSEAIPDNETAHTGHKILCQIKNTMSDRAATEAKFNSILETYRKSCLPLYIKGWNNFSKSAKTKLSQMNNFFCGLHLLVSMAETISKSFKIFESIRLGSDRVGAVLLSGVKIFGSDSGTVRLVRNACKALAKGADEKSGCHRAWKTYMVNKGINQRYLQNFRGNRYNVIFLLGGCVFHIHDHIFDFFHNVHGQGNALLKVVHADIQVPLFLAGCKVLGILNKLITAPLWKITEDCGHILEMCDHYTKLHSFLDSCISSDEKLAEFVRCETTCFQETLITKDEIFDSLSKPWIHDDIVISMMHHTLVVLKQLISVTVEYLPGGKLYKLKEDETFQGETISTPKHNKLPERVFGYLDFLLKKRPNSSSIANKAQVMFVFNKTADYISSLSSENLEKIVNEAMSSSKDLREKMKNRDQQRHKELVKKQIEKQKQREVSEQNKVKRKEDLTCIIVDAGLWQSQAKVFEKMNECTTNREKHEACKKQIQFRREVLNQFVEGDKKFAFTEQGKPKPWEIVRDHLFKFIDAALSVGAGQSIQKVTQDQDSISIPLLIGKTVNHSFASEGMDKVSYLGRVISQVPGFPDWYNITYENDDAVYSYRLVDDYREGNLEIVPEALST